MKMGFTGTRHGMTSEQKEAFRSVLMDWRPSEFHHGDCIGSDTQAADIVVESCLGTEICVHPPSVESDRAFSCWGHAVAKPKRNLARNRDIVNACDVLVAAPLISSPITTSTTGGTAYTINYARRNGKRVVLVRPDGTVEDENQTAGLGAKSNG